MDKKIIPYKKRDTSSLIGKRFGRLVVVAKLPSENKKGTMWECLCDCGVFKKASKRNLARGSVSSCGCYKADILMKMNFLRRQENPYSLSAEYRNAYLRNKRLNNTVFSISQRISSSFRKSFRKHKAIKSSSTFKILGYSREDLKNHLEKQFEKWMSWNNRDMWDIDHIIPLSTAKNIEDVIRLNQLTNLRPLGKKENSEKSNKLIYLI